MVVDFFHAEYVEILICVSAGFAWFFLCGSAWDAMFWWFFFFLELGFLKTLPSSACYIHSRL